MPILTRCTHCQAKYSVPSNAVGKPAECAKCGERFTIAAASAPAASATTKSAAVAKSAPSAAAQSAPQKPKPATHAAKPTSPTTPKPRGRLTERELLAAFHEGFQRRRPGIAYQLGILLVAVTMIVLPMIYLAFIGLLIFGIVYHAQHNTAILHMGTGRSGLMAIGIYLAPIVAGAIAVFFMFKPLLARPSGNSRSRSLTRQSEPLLFAFVDRICDVVGAPQPKRIDVDCDVNASAGFRRGILSMFGSDLVLTIGLPLAAGLTVREFGGVLAHEFGHFTQGLGMRLSYVIRSIVHWFIRVVYQRDEWDDWLSAAIGELDIRVGWILLLAQLCVLIGRGILWVLFHIGLAISGLLLRQMEFDADHCETLFAGSDAFASTARKLQLLNSAAQFSQLQLGASLDRKQLVSDLPGLIAHHVRTVSPDAWQKIDEQIAASRTGWFDDHPCDCDRIAAAAKLASPGIFHLDRPAGDLFADFKAQTEAATWDLYCAFFGSKVPRSALLPIKEFVASSKV